MSKNAIICLLVGDKYDTEYVYRLKNSIERNCTKPYDFLCYSDRYIPDVNVSIIQDPEELEPVWYKIKMLGDPHLDQYECKLFFDLDVVIHNSIDNLIYAPSLLNVIQSKWKSEDEINSFLNTGCNSSIMVWHDAVQIWKLFEQDPDMFMSKYSGVGRFLWHDARQYINFIGDNIAYTYSFGASLEDNEPHIMRSGYTVCLYNQYPKPHTQLNTEPAKSHWK